MRVSEAVLDTAALGVDGVYTYLKTRPDERERPHGHRSPAATLSENEPSGPAGHAQRQGGRPLLTELDRPEEIPDHCLRQPWLAGVADAPALVPGPALARHAPRAEHRRACAVACPALRPAPR
jgi:hypothetical protein